MSRADGKSNVLFLCTGNSARSQMAEGILSQIAPDLFNVFSAGTTPAKELHPLAVAVMDEIGINISKRMPKSMDAYLGRVAVDHVIIVCDIANQACPSTWPGARERLFWPFEDPATPTGSEESDRQKFRSIRDQLKERISLWLRTGLDSKMWTQAPNRT